MAERFSMEALNLDAAEECERISRFIRGVVSGKLKKKGVVVALSGGVDSSTVAGLCVKALGKDRVFGLLMPERHSSPDTHKLSRMAAQVLGIEYEITDITSILEVLGCYKKQEAAYRKVIPEFTKEWQTKIILPSVTESDRLRLFSVVAMTPEGVTIERRLTYEAYLELISAVNFKQRTRKMLEYYHADRLNFAVTGTPNKLEYDQGFFVKLGDGMADIKPIAHLYKTQVYQLAKYLGIPEEILKRPPTTDTYSLPQGQDEFYFSLPYKKMDICLFGYINKIPETQVAAAADLTIEELKRVYRDIKQKRISTEYLHYEPQILNDDPV